MKFNKNIIFLMFIILISACQPKEQIEITEPLESTGSGLLEIETFPNDAEIFVDRLNSGKSPITLNNIAAGSHNIVIKKEGYEDFTKDVIIEAGKKTFLEARLVLKQVEVTEPIEKQVEEDIVEEEEIETLTEDLKAKSTVNIGTKFLLYYDFSQGQFADKRNFEQDTFSKRYKQHLIFTRINPINIKTIDKNIDDVKKEDCIGIRGQFEWLYSGQTLCVITKENEIAAIGGVWQETENAELTWKLFS